MYVMCKCRGGYMSKIKYLVVFVVVGLMMWGIFALINKSLYVSEVINVERYRSCTIGKCEGNRRKVNIKDERRRVELFNIFMSRRIKRTLPWEKDFKTYYRIITDDNNLVIYNNEYLSVQKDNMEIIYKFIKPINPDLIEKYFEDYSGT